MLKAGIDQVNRLPSPKTFLITARGSVQVSSIVPMDLIHKERNGQRGAGVQLKGPATAEKGKSVNQSRSLLAQPA